MVKIAPSILSANFNTLASDVVMIDNAGADYIHIDVMDGRFVPNISFGPVVVSRIKEITKKPLDVHLMILEAEKYIEEFAKIGADIITVQYEATQHLDRLINLIKSLGIKASVAINPATPIEAIKPIIPIVSQVLIMSVNPGFGGQKFIPYCLDKVKQTKDFILEKGLNVDVEVDGGVTEANASDLVKAGVDVLVAGSTVFKSSDIKRTIKNLKSA